MPQASTNIYVHHYATIGAILDPNWVQHSISDSAARGLTPLIFSKQLKITAGNRIPQSRWRDPELRNVYNWRFT